MFLTLEANTSLLCKPQDQFNAGTIPVLLGHPASMGHGLNLQGSCHHIIWFSVPWDLDFYDQTIARVYRQGQKSDTVFVYHIVARGVKGRYILLITLGWLLLPARLLKALGQMYTVPMRHLATIALQCQGKQM